jgi:hypothetical protein
MNLNKRATKNNMKEMISFYVALPLIFILCIVLVNCLSIMFYVQLFVPSAFSVGLLISAMACSFIFKNKIYKFYESREDSGKVRNEKSKLNNYFYRIFFSHRATHNYNDARLNFLALVFLLSFLAYMGTSLYTAKLGDVYKDKWIIENVAPTLIHTLCHGGYASSPSVPVKFCINRQSYIQLSRNMANTSKPSFLNIQGHIAITGKTVESYHAISN